MGERKISRKRDHGWKHEPMSKHLVYNVHSLDSFFVQIHGLYI